MKTFIQLNPNGKPIGGTLTYREEKPHNGSWQELTAYPVEMQTFTYVKTPGYPVGVFNVNRQLLGQAATAYEFAEKWNADAVNKKLGTLTPTAAASTRFFFEPKPTTKRPPIIYGHRFYQLDLNAKYLDSHVVPYQTVVDFGNGRIETINKETKWDYNTTTQIGLRKSSYFVKGTRFNFYTAEWSGYDNRLNSHLWSNDAQKIQYGYPDATVQARTVTFYHPEGDCYMDDNNFWIPSTLSLDTYKNLRGNLPNGLFGARWNCNQDTTYHTFSGITNEAEWRDKFKHMNFRNGGYTDFGGYNFGDLTRFKNVIGFDLGATYAPNFTGITPAMVFGATTTSIATAFPKMKVLAIPAALYTNTINYAPAKWLHFICRGTPAIGAAEVDKLYNDLEAKPNEPGGSVWIQNQGTPTAASATARANLLARGVTIY